MKYMFMIVAMLSLVASSAFAQYAAVGKVVNSPHDLSSTSTAAVKNSSGFTQICAFCHVAHKAGTAPAGDQNLLWNHTLSASATTAKYSSPTFDALNTDQAVLAIPTWGTASTSQLCMSCHDGTIGVNAIYKFATPTIGAIANHTDLNSKLLTTNNAYLGLDLAGSHPLNFTYSGTASNTHIKAKDVGNTVNTIYPLDGTGKMQCNTCHNAHDDTTNTYFLRKTLAGSALCIDCHLAT